MKTHLKYIGQLVKGVCLKQILEAGEVEAGEVEAVAEVEVESKNII